MIRLVDEHGVSLGVDPGELDALYNELWEMTETRGSLPALPIV